MDDENFLKRNMFKTIHAIMLKPALPGRTQNYFSEVEALYKDVYTIVPLQRPMGGMKVRIDGRTFINYAQIDSGIVVPHYVASQVDLPQKAYVAKDSMVCNFA
jgi:hypothetical protein